MKGYSIKDLENITGIKAHTIRIWEQRYGILKPNRTDTNIRKYSNDELKYILNVSFLNNNGYKISQISRMDNDEMGQTVLKLSEKSFDYTNQVDSLVVAMVEMNEERFEKMIATNILKLGFEKTITHVIFPLLNKIGVMWLADAINPAQEHFITNLIRQKIIVATDGQVVNYSASAKRFLLFLPEGELHEIGLLYLNYIIKSRKGHSLYLGQSVPFEDMVKTTDVYNPDFICLLITYQIHGFELEEYIQLIANSVSNKRILLTGYAVVQAKESLKSYKNLTIFENLQQMIAFVEEHI